MTTFQIVSFMRLVQKMTPTEFHHGVCIGADEEAHKIIRAYWPDCRIICHPPSDQRRIARGLHCDVTLPPRPFLVRNRDIVDAVDILVGCPRQEQEVIRSGTWATMRYAKKTGKNVILIPPRQP